MRRYREHGFTLIELSVVIALVGLIVVAVLGGMHLQRQYRLQEVVSNVDTYKRSTDIFKKKYLGYPGDLFNASTLLQDILPTQNGDGDDNVERSDLFSESLRFWLHLAASGLLDGKFDGQTHQRGEGLPSGPLFNSSYQAFHRDNGDGLELTLLLARTNDEDSSGLILPSLDEADLSILTPSDALALDRRYDDGFPLSGKIRAADGTDAVSTCVVDAVTYQLSNENKDCILYFIF